MATGFDGSTAKVYGGGYDLTSFFKSVKVSGGRNTYDYTTLSALWRLFKYGRASGEATCEGIHGTAPLGLGPTMSAMQGVTSVLIQLPEGATSGSICGCISGDTISRAIKTDQSDVVMAVMQITAKGGSDLGVLLMTPASISATTTYPASGGIDTGVTASNGGALYLNVITVAGTAAQYTLKLQSCATSGGAYADVAGATWPAASIVSGYNNKLEIPVGTAILQFVQLVATKGASASDLTAVCALARRSA